MMRQVCFVDMPFGKKTDPKSGIEIDFDQIYELGIRPAIENQDLEAIRGDREETGGIIHAAMFARLLISEFVVADMTTANPNVFYELGIRHAAKPHTTIPIFATIGAPPFDVNMVRAIPYGLEHGHLIEIEAKRLRGEIGKRIHRALHGPTAKDSPLFGLFPNYPGIEISHELTDVFRDRVAYSATFKDRLRVARVAETNTEAIKNLDEIANDLGNLATAERGVLVDLLLSYRAVKAYDKMVELIEAMPSDARNATMVRQQLAFALNLRNGAGDRDRAIRELQALVEEQGDSAETLGILGRIHKDRYKEAVHAGSLEAAGHLDLAIETYVRGFESEPLDYYPGMNAITLLSQKGGENSEQEIARLAPLVTFAAVRRGGENAMDYWTVATVLELATVNGDQALVNKCLPRLLTLANEGWMLEATAKNLRLIAVSRIGTEDAEWLETIVSEMEAAASPPEKKK